MDFLPNSISIQDVVLAMMAVLGIIGFVAVGRIMRQGRHSFSARHEAMDNRIKETTQDMRERNNSMQSSEQLHIIASALKDVLEIKGHNAHEIITEYPDRVELNLPQGLVSVHYMQKTKTLRSIQKTMHGQGLWEVRQGDMVQTFNGLIQLERHLQSLLAGL